MDIVKNCVLCYLNGEENSKNITNTNVCFRCWGNSKVVLNDKLFNELLLRGKSLIKCCYCEKECNGFSNLGYCGNHDEYETKIFMKNLDEMDETHMNMDDFSSCDEILDDISSLSESDLDLSLDDDDEDEDNE
jgi:hypothetical protein